MCSVSSSYSSSICSPSCGLRWLGSSLPIVLIPTGAVLPALLLSYSCTYAMGIRRICEHVFVGLKSVTVLECSRPPVPLPPSYIPPSPFRPICHSRSRSTFIACPFQRFPSSSIAVPVDQLPSSLLSSRTEYDVPVVRIRRAVVLTSRSCSPPRASRLALWRIHLRDREQVRVCICVCSAQFVAPMHVYIYVPSDSTAPATNRGVGSDPQLRSARQPASQSWYWRSS